MAFQTPIAVCAPHLCLTSTSNKCLEQSMASVMPGLRSSMKSSLNGPWRNIRQQSPPAVVSMLLSHGQPSASTEPLKAKSNVSPGTWRFFNLVLTLTVHFNSSAARMLSISSHGRSQTSTLGRFHPRGSAFKYGYHLYVTPAGFPVYYLRSPRQLPPRSFDRQIQFSWGTDPCHGLHDPIQRYHPSNS